MKALFPILYIAGSLVFAGVSSGENAGPDILYTANRQGSIEPCGCTTNQIGGIDRMANWVQSSRKEKDAILLDSGDTFFSAPEINPHALAMEINRAKLIAEAYREMAVLAVAPGERDFAAGIPVMLELERKGGFQWLSANLVDGLKRIQFKPVLWLERKGKKIAVTAVSRITSGIIDSEIEVASPIKILRETVKTILKDKPDLLIILSHDSFAGDQALAKEFQGVIILGGHSMDGLDRPYISGTTAVFQPTLEGQAVGRIRWDYEKKTLIKHDWVELNKSFARQNRVSRLMKKFYQKEKKEAAKPVADLLNTGPKYVANPVHCETCHKAQYDFWEATKHSSAMLVLYSKGRHYDSECVGCHTLGFQELPGFARMAHSLEVSKPLPTKENTRPFEYLLKEAFSKDQGAPLDSRAEPERFAKIKKAYHENLRKIYREQGVVKNYLGVQCEHCHGNREGHPATKREHTPVSTTTCLKCHTPERSPEFKPEWKARIACPLLSKN